MAVADSDLVALENLLDIWGRELSTVKLDLVALEEAFRATCAESAEEDFSDTEFKGVHSFGVETGPAEKCIATSFYCVQTEVQCQVEEVLERLDTQKVPLQRLRERVSRLVNNASQEGIVEKRWIVSECQDVARNLGKGLLDDAITLDELSSVSVEERNEIKTTVVRLETSLEEVGNIILDLVGLEAELDAIVEEELAGGRNPELSRALSVIKPGSSQYELRIQVISASGIQAPELRLGDISKRLMNLPLVTAPYIEFLLGTHCSKTQATHDLHGDSVQFVEARALMLYRSEPEILIRLRDSRRITGILSGNPLIGDATLALPPDDGQLRTAELNLQRCGNITGCLQLQYQMVKLDEGCLTFAVAV